MKHVFIINPNAGKYDSTKAYRYAGNVDNTKSPDFMPASYTLLPYMNTSHFIMPLYSFRFLAACWPKVRSNSV